MLEADAKRALAEPELMDQPRYSMDRSRREAGLGALVGLCTEQ